MRLEKGQIWEMVRRLPEYEDGRLTEEQAEEVVELMVGSVRCLVRTQRASSLRNFRECALRDR